MKLRYRWEKLLLTPTYSKNLILCKLFAWKKWCVSLLTSTAGQQTTTDGAHPALYSMIICLFTIISSICIIQMYIINVLININNEPPCEGPADCSWACRGWLCVCSVCVCVHTSLLIETTLCVCWASVQSWESSILCLYISNSAKAWQWQNMTAATLHYFTLRYSYNCNLLYTCTRNHFSSSIQVLIHSSG